MPIILRHQLLLLYNFCIAEVLEAQSRALNAEHSNLRDKLNVETIVQFLNSKFLLTPDEMYTLTDTSRPLGKRVDFIVEILPRKGSKWWEKFLQCLTESHTRPGLGAHKELAELLNHQLNQQLKYEVSSYTLSLAQHL